MLKTALFDCVINEKCCSVVGGRGICRLFLSPPRGIWPLKSPPGGGGGAGRRWNWLIHKMNNNFTRLEDAIYYILRTLFRTKDESYESLLNLVGMDMLWFNFILGLNFIFFCFKLIIIHYHTQKQKKIKFKPRIKLNHNRYFETPSLLPSSDVDL